MKASSILGLNARAAQYSYKYNKARGKRIAASKLATFRMLLSNGIPTPEVYKVIGRASSLEGLDWGALPDSFVLKPSRGLGGEGIIVIKKRSRDGQAWITTNRERLTKEDMGLHVLDVLEGAYSLSNKPDVVLVQEYVGRHKAFRKYAYRGTPDIRVIVFNKVPVMAMLRLPTKESGGRANLHQGAVGVGIDIATGITTKAIQYGESIISKPGTKRKLRGIKVPSWGRMLSIAGDVQEKSNLGLLAVDMLLHPEKGPMVIELNNQPGLQIQLANSAGLRKRLERVEDLEVKSAEHGINIAKALFAAKFADRVKEKGGVRTISALEEIMIYGAKKSLRKKVVAKIDTGAWRTSVNQKLAEDMGLLADDNILWTKKVRSSLGTEVRPVINLRFKLAGKKIATPASVAKRKSLKYQVIIGRKNLKGFLVDPKLDPKDNKYSSRK